MKTPLRITALAIALGLVGLAGNAAAAPQRAVQAATRQQRQQQQQQQQQQQEQAPQPVRAAAAAVRTPAETKQVLIDTARKANVPHFVAPNGKVIYNPHTPEHVEAINQVSKPGSGIMQILQIEGVQHTLGHFEGQNIHFQYATGTSNWRLRYWTDKLRHRDRRMYSAMIQLSPHEAENLRNRLNGIFQEEGPEEKAGQNWANGHITKSVGVNYFNCASAWCEMPIGQNGESIARVIGIPSSGDPYSLQRSFEGGGNERVIGIGLYGPKREGLGQNPNERFTR